ncbi:MAG: hypothetical protein ABIF12_02310 [bacterium]
MKKSSLEKILLLFLIILINNAQAINPPQTYLIKEEKKKSDKTVTSNKIAVQRILIKSLNSSVFKILEMHSSIAKDKIKKESNLIKDINAYKLGQILAELFIDEILQNNNPTKLQKISESLIPIIITEISCHNYKNYLQNKNAGQTSKENLNNLIKKIIIKLCEKTIKSNFFFR